MSIKLEDVKKILAELNGNTNISIKIPSTGVSYEFKPITVATRKTMAKYSLNEYNTDSMLSFQVSKLALIKTLCIDENFDETKLSEVDFIYVLACLRQFNILDELVVTATCPKCKKTINHTLDLNKIITNCENHTQLLVSKERHDRDGIKWSFILAEPSMYNTIILEKYLIDNNKTEADRDLMKPFLYIESLCFNDEMIEEFTAMDIMEKIAFLNTLDDRLLYDKNGVIEAINQEYKDDFRPYDDIKCNNAECDHILEGAVTSDSFFIC